jgi:hypothetical protein
MDGHPRGPGSLVRFSEHNWHSTVNALHNGRGILRKAAEFCRSTIWARLGASGKRSALSDGGILRSDVQEHNLGIDQSRDGIGTQSARPRPQSTGVPSWSRVAMRTRTQVEGSRRVVQLIIYTTNRPSFDRTSEMADFLD